MSKSKPIIGGKRYPLEKRNLLCEVTLCNPNALIDFKSKTLYLYCLQGKAFIVDIVHDLTGQHEPPRIITRDKAIKIMDKYPWGIKESVYIRYFGNPDKV